jgi:ferredoxin
VGLVLLLGSVAGSVAVDRFPRPEFESGYDIPAMQLPMPRAAAWEYIDVVVLVVALAAASYLALRRRSRVGVLVLTVACLLYFGFWRKGCVCPVGSVQNVAMGLLGDGYAVPLSVLFLFALPLLFALLCGRVFCAAVCPLGAIQELVVCKPLRLPAWLKGILGIVPCVVLGLSVLLATAGAGFVVCRFDPFVGFFRLGASSSMLVFGAGLLLLGTVVARPYCRFLCPYGVLLGWFSRLSKWHVTITPTDCINCRLCEDACPFDAIRSPTPRATEARAVGIRRLALLLVFLPIAVVVGGWVVSCLHIPLSRVHPVVLQAEQVLGEELGLLDETTLDSEVFRQTGEPEQELYREALGIRQHFRRGGWVLGGFLGLVLVLRMMEFSVRRRREYHSIDREFCLSCTRCLEYCVKEQELRKKRGKGDG